MSTRRKTAIGWKLIRLPKTTNKGITVYFDWQEYQAAKVVRVHEMYEPFGNPE